MVDPDFCPDRGDPLPPQSIEAEEAVLGGILLDPEAISRVVDKLTPQAFYVGTHADIYQAMVRLAEKGKPTDLLAVMSWLTDNDLLAKIGGRNKLASLVDCTVSAVNIDALADLVLDKYKRRQLIKAGNEIIGLGYETQTDLEQVLERSEAKLLNVTKDVFGDTEPIPLASIMVNTFQTLEQRYRGENLIGHYTGFYDLDTMLGGLKPGRLVTVAARPGCGKSAFLGNVALNMGYNNLPVVIFSMEMGQEEWGDRLLSVVTSIESGYFASGRIGKTQWEPIAEGINKLSQLPIFIDDAPSISVCAISAKVRRLIAQYGQLGIVGIDYLGLLEGVDSDGGNLAHSIGKVTRSLKQLSRECNVPVVLLCQLNRTVEGRQNKRPSLSDLRDSGRIEEDSDVVIGLYRDELYEPHSPDRGICEVIILKHRGGQIGTARLLFDPQFTQFKNLAKPPNTY